VNNVLVIWILISNLTDVQNASTSFCMYEMNVAAVYSTVVCMAHAALLRVYCVIVFYGMGKYANMQICKYATNLTDVVRVKIKVRVSSSILP